MIRRSSKTYIDNLLNQNPNWNILDIGCGYTAHKNATVICDVQDLSNIYKEKNFVKLTSNILPFKDKEFDFVIASHVIEHVKDVHFFIKELQRVSSKGYIELPTKLEDNLVFENKKDHLWHMEFDDDKNQLIINLNQVQSDGSLFEMPIEVGIVYENNIHSTELIEVRKKTNLFIIDVDKEPKNVILDPNYWVLMTKDFNKKN